MLRIGITLIAAALLSLLLPALGRQFAVVSLLQVTGLASWEARLALLAAGGLLVYLGLRQSGPTSLAAATVTHEPERGPWIPITFIGVVAVLALLATTTKSPMSATTQIEHIVPPATLPRHPPFRGPVAFAASDAVVVIVRRGEDKSDGSLELEIDLKPASEIDGARGQISRALILLRQPFCSDQGFLATHGLGNSPLTLTVSERERPVGRIPVPSNYCEAAR